MSVFVPVTNGYKPVFLLEIMLQAPPLEKQTGNRANRH